MALRTLLLRKRLDDQTQALAKLRTTAAGFEAREAELESDIAEAQTDEERSAVEAAVEAFEAERDANTQAISEAEAACADLEAQIAAEEARAAEAAAAQQRNAAAPANNNHERNDTHMPTIPEVRGRFNMTAQQRAAFFEREDVAAFIGEIRDATRHQRSITNAGLGVPQVYLDLLRDNLGDYSKLIKYVSLRSVSGKARQNVVGQYPEGVWTEAVNVTLNELALAFTQLELDAYKVGGWLAIDRAYAEDDSNLNLGTEITEALLRAIGTALDKAILYGTGSKMPVGIVTRLAASSQPAWWGSNQGAFTDLHTSNVRTLNIAASTGETFFASLIAELGIADPHYSDGKQFWAMNRKTHIAIQAKALAFNSAAALAAGVSNTFPIIGGDIVELDFMSDNDIAGGYGSVYRLVERDGAVIENSDQPFWLQDATAYKASARYDGKPARGENFVIVNFANTSPTTSISFKPDAANSTGTLTVTSSAGTASGDTAITVTGATSGATLKYLISTDELDLPTGFKPSSKWRVLTDDDITAATGKICTVIELNDAGVMTKKGSATVTAHA